MVKTPDDYAAQALRLALRAPGVQAFAGELRRSCAGARDCGAEAAKTHKLRNDVDRQDVTARQAWTWAHYTANAARDARKGDAYSAADACAGAEYAANCAGYYAEVASW